MVCPFSQIVMNVVRVVFTNLPDIALFNCLITYCIWHVYQSGRSIFRYSHRMCEIFDILILFQGPDGHKVSVWESGVTGPEHGQDHAQHDHTIWSRCGPEISGPQHDVGKYYGRALVLRHRVAWTRSPWMILFHAFYMVTATRSVSFLWTLMFRPQNLSWIDPLCTSDNTKL